MAGILSNLCNFDDAINKFNSIMNNTVSELHVASFKILDHLNEIIAINGKEFVNNTLQAGSEALLQAADKVRQDALDVIDKFSSNLSAIVDSAIEHAKNATTNVFDESIQRLGHESDTFVESIVNNRFVIILAVFILIIFFSATLCLFHHLATNIHWCYKLFEVLSNMLSIIVLLLTAVWFGLTLVSFFERAINDKAPFYIIGTIILLSSILYGICHLCWFVKTTIAKGRKRFGEKA